MIQSHLYTNKKETSLYSDKRMTADLICILGKGMWLGEIEREDGWIHVLGIQGDGWVKTEDVETRSPFNLHVHWTPGQPIEYVSTAA
jgi:hypothetical protein